MALGQHWGSIGAWQYEQHAQTQRGCRGAGVGNLLFELDEDKLQDVVAGDACGLAVALALTAHQQEQDIESEHAGPQGRQFC